MSVQQADDVDVIERLERSNRVLLGTVLGLTVFVLIGAAIRPDVVQATTFQIVDADGNVRGELGVRDGDVGLFVDDEAGRERLRAAHGAEGTGLFLADEAGTVRVGVAQFSHGGGGVALHGPDAKGAAVLYYQGEGSLRFFDAEGAVTNEVPAARAGTDTGRAAETEDAPSGR